MSPAARAPQLPAVVKSLGAVSFFNDLASEMIYPLIPALVTQTLRGGAVALGLFDGISEAVASLAKLWAGWAADRPLWRRPLVIWGYVVAAATRPVIGATSSAWQVIALRATDRIGKGIRTPPRDAVIADAAPREIRGRAFGFHRAMDHAGAVVGPLLAWLLLAGAGLSPDRVILWSVVPGVAAVGMVAWAMKDGGKGKTEKGEVDGHSSDREVPAGSGSPRLVFALVVGFAFARFPETLLLLRLQDLRLSVALVPLVWAALHVVRTIGSYPGGRLTDAFGPRRVMLGGWVLYGLVCWGLARAPTAATGVGWFLVFGLVAALTESPERWLVATGAGQGATGRGFGNYHAGVGAAALVGGLMFGTIYSRAGGPAALTLSALVAGLLTILLLLGRTEAPPLNSSATSG